MNPGQAGVFAAVVLASYIMGSVPFGFLAARARGIDILKIGSGATGATNVLRVLGPFFAIPVLLLDVGKGALAAYLGLRYSGMGTLGALIAGSFAIAGHNWSVFLRLKGGKGVATSAGVALVAFPTIFAAALAVFVATVALTRYVSLGSLLAAWSALLVSLSPRYGLVERIPVLVLVLLITVQHRSNIRRLLDGNERKIGEKVDVKGNAGRAAVAGAGPAARPERRRGAGSIVSPAADAACKTAGKDGAAK